MVTDSLLCSKADELMVHAFDVPSDQSLSDGQLGMALVLHHYAALVQSKEVGGFASYLLDYVIGRAPFLQSFDLPTGLTGLGWGIEYLVHHGMADCDAGDICEDIDLRLLDLDLMDLCRRHDEASLCGISHYLWAHYGHMHEDLQKQARDAFSEFYGQHDSLEEAEFAKMDSLPYLCGIVKRLMDGERVPEAGMDLGRFVRLSGEASGHGLQKGLAGELERMLGRLYENGNHETAPTVRNLMKTK